MTKRAGVCKDAATGCYRILIHQWLNTTERSAPAVHMFFPEAFATGTEAEAHLSKTVLPDLKRKMKSMAQSLPMLSFRSGRLKPEQMADTEPQAGGYRRQRAEPKA